MSPEFEKKCYAAFPELFRGRFKAKEESSMCWGLDCGDKWFDFLWQHCLAIEGLALQEGRSRNGNDWPEVTQVKEKFGTLRFYIANESNEMRELRYKLMQGDIDENIS